MTHSNAKLNGAVNGKDKNDNAVVDTSAAGTGLQCLEDPTFSFDEPSQSSKSLPADAAKENAPKRPSYRVLEDPDLDTIPPRGRINKELKG